MKVFSLPIGTTAEMATKINAKLGTAPYLGVATGFTVDATEALMVFQPAAQKMGVKIARVSTDDIDTLEAKINDFLSTATYQGHSVCACLLVEDADDIFVVFQKTA